MNKIWFSILCLTCLFIISQTNQAKTYAKGLLKIMRAKSDRSKKSLGNKTHHLTADITKQNIHEIQARNKTYLHSSISQNASTSRRSMRNGRKNDKIIQGGIWQCSGIWKSNNKLSDTGNLQGWFIGNCSGFSNVSGNWSATALDGNWVEEPDGSTNSDHKMQLKFNARAVLNEFSKKRMPRGLITEDYRRSFSLNNSDKQTETITADDFSPGHRQELKSISNKLKVKDISSERYRKKLNVIKKPYKNRIVEVHVPNNKKMVKQRKLIVDPHDISSKHHTHPKVPRGKLIDYLKDLQ
ncbi:hypothetical protein ILUMI_10373 [Ignelater luminosus]|uniref:Uncharacterized protein n=1 Tax=Ignelater luminosus TaxID=2038154 RepID=A0A8K0D416_IGNLU|nr:hypothetical protein ILUMI_10373 [Ignelater luminosus]